MNSNRKIILDFENNFFILATNNSFMLKKRRYPKKGKEALYLKKNESHTNRTINFNNVRHIYKNLIKYNKIETIYSEKDLLKKRLARLKKNHLVLILVFCFLSRRKVLPSR